jgi:putative Mg2+ transporter-C (MgtC) family protein
MNDLLSLQIGFLLPVFLAIFLGGLIGFERERLGKVAGMRTHALVTLGSTLFTIVSYVFSWGGNADGSRIASQIVVGIGFLGAGLLIQTKERVANVTTAAGLWVCAALGMVIGIGWYILAILITVVIVILLQVFRESHEFVERFEEKRKDQGENL